MHFITQLLPEFTHKLHNSIQNLLSTLERYLPQHIDWGDVSVYTGTSGYIYLYLHLANCLNDPEAIQVMSIFSYFN